MATTRKKKVEAPKVIRTFTHVQYVAPSDCDSVVGYNGKLGEYEYDSIALKFTDCSRTVSWEIYGTPEGLAKLRSAIEVLQKLERELTDYLLEQQQLKPRVAP